ncbi:MAG TPA: DUF86 domain-containing protein [Euzebya sp.]|nr:DUF86 domain-containing protein [Euzebya sp.]
MVDADRLVELLERVTARLRVLDAYAEQPAGALVIDEVRMGHLKYTLQTMLEACIDAAHHVVASEGLGVPATNADAFRRLGAADLLDDTTADGMAAAAGLRNVLVHGYAAVDDARVVQHLNELPTIRSFVRAMTTLIGG